LLELRYGSAGSVFLGEEGIMHSSTALLIKTRTTPGQRAKASLQLPVRI
jgi:hypothetical protein